MDILNNREWAIVIWLFIFLVFTFSSKRMAEVRAATKNVIASLFVTKIIVPVLLMATYMGVVIYWLSEFNLWNSEQLKNTVFWGVSVGFLSFFKIQSFNKDRGLFKHLVISNLKLLAVLQLIIGAYTFPIYIELVMTPILIILSAMLAMSKTDHKYRQAENFLSVIMIAWGTFTIFYAFYMMGVNFGKIANEKTIYDFFVPPLLSFFYIPFLFMLMLYSSYENEFLKTRYPIKSKWLRFLAKIYAVIVFNVRNRKLERWASHVARQNISSHKELIATFKHMFRTFRLEKNPKEVARIEGWCPYTAKDFLRERGLPTGHYNDLDGEWFACSTMLDIGQGLISNNLAFYIDGVESVAKALKIKLNINNPSEQNGAKETLLESADVLSLASLGVQLPPDIKKAILEGSDVKCVHENKEISVVREDWENHRDGGYDIIFKIAVIEGGQ